jgi:aminopeptidase N
MFFKVAGFEFRYQLRQPIFWVAAILFVLLTFGSVASDNVQIGSTDNIHKNAAYVIGQSTLIMAVLFGLLVITALVANVITRDDETGFGAIVRSTRISKFDYLYGRFAGAMAAAAVAFLSVPVGLALGAAAPWVDQETVGPFVFGDYAYAYFVVGLPVLVLCGALFFTLTTLTRSMVWTYVGVIGLFVARTVFGIVVQRPELQHLAALGEPFGTSAFAAATRYWTASERNAMMPPLAGDFLVNKLIWLGVAAAALAAAYWLFSFKSAERSGRARRARRAVKAAAAAPVSAPETAAGPHARPRFGAATTWAQFLARGRLDAAQIFLSPAYFVLLGLAAIVAGASVFFATQLGVYDSRVYPVTRVMIAALTGGFSIFGFVIAIYYSGELVWRERDRRTEEIIDAAPVPDWIFIVPKVLVIALVLISTQAVAVAVAILGQAVQGYTNFQVGDYVLWYLLPNAADYLLIAALAVVVQALVPHKFIGWGVMMVYIIATIVLPGLGFSDNLYLYDGGPNAPLSDMDGQGRFWIGAWWFRFYWGAFALALLVIAYALWRRGTETRLKPRLAAAPRRLKGPAGALLGVALVLFVGSGGFIFYNTHVLNPFRTSQDEDRWQADYEKTFLAYESLPQPKIASVKLDLEVWPDQTRIVTHGVYVLQNRTQVPVSSVHVRFPRDLEVSALQLDGARLSKDFPGFNYRIYALDRPMAPGETRNLAFTTTYEQRGFPNGQPLVRIVDNGTFVNDRELAPQIGMDRQGLLEDRSKRRKYGLPPELATPRLGQPGADQFSDISHDADWVNADITVTTAADQTPIAPGYRASETVANGRRTVRFVTDSPILDFFSAQSARYAVASTPYKGVDISVYYDPQHPWNISRIQNVMRAGLDYYQANFSPYQFHQVRVLEFPAPDGSFAQSFANTIPWSEGIFFIADERDPDRIDMVTYVGAHELAHQWWAHQVIGADEQGGAMLSETLAQYSAGQVMKHLYGADMMRKFLKFELDSYLRSRGSAVKQELPLTRVEDQDYIYYRKGSVVMYRLADEIGEDKVNAALRQLLHDFAFKGPPYPTTIDLEKDIRAQAPAGAQDLITDLFDKITLYDIRASHAVARKRPDGRWDLTFTVEATKFYADGLGRETPAPMNETVDVGAFDAEPGQPGYRQSDVIDVEKRPIHSGTQTVSLTVAHLPRFAGVDPFNTLIDRNSEATITKVSTP